MNRTSLLFLEHDPDPVVAETLRSVVESAGATFHRFGNVREVEAADVSASTVVAIGLRIGSPAAVARQIHRVMPDAHLVFLTNRERVRELENELRFAPMIGTNWLYAPVDNSETLAESITSALKSSAQRRHLRTTLDRANVRIGAAAVDSTKFRKLVISDRYLASILVSASDAILSTDEHGIITAANPAAIRTLGAESLTGRNIEEVICGESLERFREVSRQDEEPQAPLVEVIACRNDGTRFPAEISIARVFDDNQSPIGRSFIVRDTTERTALEDERRRLLESEQRTRIEAEEAEQRFRDLLHSVDAIVWEAETNPFRFTFVNRRAEDILGYSIKQWIANAGFWPSVVHPDDRSRVLDLYGRSREVERQHDFEYRVISADGRIVWIRDLVYAGLPSTNAPLRGIMLDITRRKEIDVAREDEQERAILLSDTTSALARSFDYAETLRGVADVLVPRFADSIAIDVAENSVRGPWSTVQHADRSRREDVVRLQQIAAKERSKLSTRVSASTGSIAFLPRIDPAKALGSANDAEHAVRAAGYGSVIVVPFRSRSVVFGALAIARDSSRVPFSRIDCELVAELGRRAALYIDNSILYESAQQANRTKDEFLATLSHELRTPMTAILGWARMLGMGGLDPATEQTALDTIERSATAQAQLIDDVLDVSRVVTGKLRLNMHDVDVATVLGSALETIRPAAEAKGIVLKSEIDDDLPPLYGDPARIQQIAWNLVSNAIKFTPKGGHVVVSAERSQSVLRISVRDTGQGIDPGFLPYVFDRFRQAEGSTTRSHGGLGLGLAIVRHLTEAHGGSVSASSEGLGKGATFIVDLPVRAVGAERRERVSPKEAVADAPGDAFPDLRGIRALVVDNDEAAREMIGAILERGGAEVRRVESSIEALDTLQSEQFDLLVSDIAMPYQDGNELIRHWRNLEAGSTRRLPAIALTAQGGSDARERALTNGYDEYVRKPVDPIVLARVAANVLRAQNKAR